MAVNGKGQEAEMVEVQARGGLGNVGRRLRAGEEVPVAYFGGSITQAQEGWRSRTHRWLSQRYTGAKVVEINAGMGGTGSGLGAFRFQRDVLAQRPGLVFVEFAVNDAGTEEQEIVRAVEGIVRQAWRADPALDLCLVYTLTDGMVKKVLAGTMPPSVIALEKVAAHYAIPSVHLGLEVVRLAREGKLVLRAAPAGSAAAGEEAGKIVFSKDGVHPLAEGHQLYAEALGRALPGLLEMAAVRHEVGAALRADNYEAAKMVGIDQVKLRGRWRKVGAEEEMAKGFEGPMPEVWAGEPGATMEVLFTGTVLGFFDVIGPTAGEVVVRMDGEEPWVMRRFDAYCTWYRMHWSFAGRQLPDQEHRVVLEVSEEKLDKEAILAERQGKLEPAERFARQEWYVGGVMVIGEMAG